MSFDTIHLLSLFSQLWYVVMLIFLHLIEADLVVDSLHDDYIKSRHSFDVDEWPPDQPKTGVNVAVIHYKGSRTEQELIEICKRHKEGTNAVNELAHNSRVTKDISKLFAADLINSTETVR